MNELQYLYAHHRAAWVEKVAPDAAMAIATHTDATLVPAWEGMGRDFQIAVWRLLPAAERQRIKLLREVPA